MPKRLHTTLPLGFVAAMLCGLPALSAQSTGVSHPEEVPVQTSADGVAQPVVYEDGTMPASAPVTPRPLPVPAKPSAAVPAAAEQAAAPSTWKPGEIITTPDSAYHPYRAPGTATPAPEPVASVTTLPTIAVREAADGAVVERVDGPANQLPAGTLLRVRMGQDISTATATVGSTFSAPLTAAIERDGRVIFPVGAVLSGHITEVRGGTRIRGRAMLHLEPTAVTLPDGTHYAIRAQVIDTGLPHRTRVDGEGTILRRDHALATMSEIGLTTGSGAAAGAVFGGVPGALIGAGVGAGLGTAVWLKQDRQAELPADTPVVFSLTAPVAIVASTLEASTQPAGTQ